MFICNFKVNSNFLLKMFLVLLLLIVLSIVAFSIYKLFNNASFTVDDALNNSQVYSLTSENYTNVLRAVHNDLDNYVGQQISFSGYVYRVSDFSSTQFVLARNMVISSDFQTLVVGFLCNSSSASIYSDGTWVHITRNYHKRKLSRRNPSHWNNPYGKTEKPKDEYVYPPDEQYAPTSTVLWKIGKWT